MKNKTMKNNVNIEQGNNKIWIHPDDIGDFIDGIKKIEEAI